MVKSLTGGDTVAARFMRGEWFEFKPQFTPWILTNHKPIVRGTDEGIWRRIRLVPFNVTIPKDQRDHSLPGKLRDELPGILNWALAGCLAWQRDGLPTPAAVEQATAAYRAEQDTIGAFIEEACDTAPGLNGKTSDLYSAYTTWCSSSGERPMTKKAFGLALAERGYEPGRLPGGARCWTGIAALQDGDTLL
jgi:putative DNA primase/helicase